MPSSNIIKFFVHYPNRGERRVVVESALHGKTCHLQLIIVVVILNLNIHFILRRLPKQDFLRLHIF
jgi:hypothetical protein